MSCFQAIFVVLNPFKYLFLIPVIFNRARCLKSSVFFKLEWGVLTVFELPFALALYIRKQKPWTRQTLLQLSVFNT